MSLTLLLLLFVFQIFPLLLIQKSAAPRGKSGQVQTKETNGTDDTTLLESGQPSSTRRTTPPNNEVRLISYNIRWRSGDELKEIIENFRKDEELGNPTILALQEVDRNKKRSGKANTAKLIADELGLHYAWAAPPPAKLDDEEETGVAILSIYPLTNLKRIVFPHEGPNRRRRVALGATVRVGNRDLRVYSAHAETRISMEKKLQQLNALLEDLARQPPETPAVIMGDLNTWQGDAPEKTIKLFSDAGFSTPFDNQKTFSQRILLVPIQFRLDWIWLRGLEAVDHGINRELDVSDHSPLWTIVKIPSPNSAKQQ
jgi:endonuclease/exonuclease/phosphatase family metal-dependent hydrolase